MTNTVPQIAAAMIQQNPSKAITISLHEDKITVLSAGEVDTASAMVMLGNALAVVFSELPEEVRNTTALTQLINNMNVVTIGRVQKNHPELFEMPVAIPTAVDVTAEPVPVETQPEQPVEQETPTAEAEPQPVKRARVPRTKPAEATPATKDPKPTAKTPVKRKPVQRSAGAIAGRGKTK